jgi:fibronectin type 3 domain-containing protein
MWRDQIELFRTDVAGTVTNDGVKYTKIGESLAGTAGFGTIAFNTSGVADGNFTLLAKAIDSSGNSAVETAAFVIDNTAPPVPTLAAAAAELAVGVTVGSGGAAADLSHYNIYTATTENGTYTLLISVKAGTYYHKEALLAGNWYYATAVDAVGNESAATAKKFAQPGGDTTKPVVSTFTPAADTPLRGVIKLSAQATDNVSVAGIRFEYRLPSATAWPLVSNQTTLDNSGAYSYSWNTVAESNGIQ